MSEVIWRLRRVVCLAMRCLCVTLLGEQRPAATHIARLGVRLPLTLSKCGHAQAPRAGVGADDAGDMVRARGER